MALLRCAAIVGASFCDSSLSWRCLLRSLSCFMFSPYPAAAKPINVASGQVRRPPFCLHWGGMTSVSPEWFPLRCRVHRTKKPKQVIYFSSAHARGPADANDRHAFGRPVLQCQQLPAVLPSTGVTRLPVSVGMFLVLLYT